MRKSKLKIPKVVAKPCIYHAFSLKFVAKAQCPGYACSGAAWKTAEKQQYLHPYSQFCSENMLVVARNKTLSYCYSIRLVLPLRFATSLQLKKRPCTHERFFYNRPSKCFVSSWTFLPPFFVYRLVTEISVCRAWSLALIAPSALRRSMIPVSFNE